MVRSSTTMCKKVSTQGRKNGATAGCRSATTPRSLQVAHAASDGARLGIPDTVTAGGVTDPPRVRRVTMSDERCEQFHEKDMLLSPRFFLVNIAV